MEMKHRGSQTQFRALVACAEILSVVPGEGAWWCQTHYPEYQLPL